MKVSAFLVVTFAACYFVAMYIAVRRGGAVTAARLREFEHETPLAILREIAATRGRSLKRAETVLMLLAYTIVGGVIVGAIVGLGMRLSNR